ncbi:DUF2461 domain-containing protein [Hymenobacter armeniacus]|uniref:DUF2461 domain-containing protein n=1 Tax=Hymenobacter armeniacus TaxID=2771358 RepID=A0ABR8JYY4_9BACT|nr:DUF2461 domain-containing protein [Hymenobacter armeniacus]MBD2724196.1 DUF2461 domain-containing protein [Hymenobacter armeniacus]
MQLKPLFTFLSGLAKHNERPWFQERKATYDQLRAQFVEDAEYWFQELQKLDTELAGPEGRKSVFRIYRDVRFSNNKDPYKTHFSVYFTASGKDIETPGYYLQLGPNGNTLIAGGMYQPEKEQLAAIRQEIDYNADELKTLLAAPDFQRYFGGLGGDRLKKAPAAYAADHPEIELLKHKSFVATHQMADADVLNHEDFRAYVLEVFRAMVPFCQFLRHAISQ